MDRNVFMRIKAGGERMNHCKDQVKRDPQFVDECDLAISQCKAGQISYHAAVLQLVSALHSVLLRFDEAQKA